ncbi:hypothetical protein [Amycolatopsis magusensis]|uniref:hypothetical protein n=1 Tax=Amycolatopsis magusensis TaxID=882444 RepID=UPI00378BA9FD
MGVTALAAGCSTAVDGQVRPPAPDTAPSLASADPWVVFDGVEECAVLDLGLRPHQFPAARKETAGGSRGCIADKPRFGTAGIVLDALQGLDQVGSDPAALFDGKIHGRRMVLDRESLPSTTGDCAIYLEVSDTARVMINTALSRGTTDQACEFVQQVAAAVEPALPPVSPS